jgi:sporulation protein YlmC with PRC-barrel domain
VRTADGQKLGKVSDLLVDTRSSRVRYLEVEVDKDFAKRGGRDWALIPIGAARLDDDRDDVLVDFSVADFAGIPAYDRQKFSRDYERSLRTFMRERRPSEVTPTLADREMDFYAGPEFDDRTFFTRRRGAMSGAGMSGAADRATTSGVGDRIADKLDNVKDRIDANPASKPGPDPTDRPLGPR